MSKTIRLGTRLRYPITIVRLLKSPGDQIKKQEPLLEYSFKWKREIVDEIGGDTREEEQTTTVTWDSPADGELTQWHITEGQHIVADRQCMAIKEECSHAVQFGGLCAMCGKDMTEVNWAAETRDTARAPIHMVHDQTYLTVSEDHAQQTEAKLQRRLLQSRKLSLVVDLDQTIIQACIDPTVGEWQKDPSNPNYESVKHVQSFQLEDGPSDLARRCSYYIKMRPGLKDFLNRISQMYEMHVYTMGTRAYAQNVARVVDPQGRLFGNRVISRDENGNMFAKDLQRLFPVSTHMVVIIDDRSDVWPRNRPNLIKVSPYEFFKGIGDINSSFLPKRQDLLTSDATTNGLSKKGGTKASSRPTEKTDATLKADVEMTGADDPALTKLQLEEQERAFEKQINDRPLQVLQEKLDKEDEEAEKATVQSEDSSESRSSSPPPHRHRVLQDDDTELEYLEKHLTYLHKTYYAEYDSNRGSHATNGNVDLTSVPDVGRILEELKGRVLQGFRLVLSGVLPRGIDIYRSEIGLQIMSFGADLVPKIRNDVTHLVVNISQPGREKLLEARRRPHIKIVSQEWLADCFSRWEAVDETPYLFTARLVGEEEPGDMPKGDEMILDNGEDAETEKRTPNGKRKIGLKLRLIPASGHTRKPKPVGDGDEDNSEDSDDSEIEEGLVPEDLPDGQVSPIDGLKTFNWDSADAELAEFLASGSSDEEENNDEDENDDDNDDEDYVHNEEDQQDSSSSDDSRERRARRSRSRSKTASPSSPSRKRKSHDDDEEADTESAGGDGSPAKKLRRTKSERSSSLRNQYVADEDEQPQGEQSGLPTPSGTDDADGKQQKEGTANASPVPIEEGGEEDGDLDFDEAELEAEFEREFEREFDKVGAEAEAEAEAEEHVLKEGEVGGKDTEKG
jgi:RNA polymerase II subunit A-like phosphatase